MTSKRKNLDYGIPPPITELTTEQDFKIRQMEIMLEKPETRREDIVTLLLALQRQSFVLANSLTNLVDKWPRVHPTINEDLSMFGILLETKD